MNQQTLLSALFIVLISSAFPLDGCAQDLQHRIARWEPTINKFKQQDAQTPPPDSAILFVGSSSIKGWRKYPGHFQKYRTINRGFGGSQLSEVIYFYDRIVRPYQPLQIVLYEGDNDISAGQTPQQFYQDVITFLRMTEIYLPETRVTILSIKPSPRRAKWHQPFKQANALVAGYSAKKDFVNYIDLWQAMTDPQGRPKEKYFSGDQLHMNEAGYLLWKKRLQPSLTDQALKNQ